MSLEARFRIERGEFLLDARMSVPGRGVTAIFGPSGCGKTTLLRAIAGLENDPEGSLEVGKNVWQNADTFLPPHQRPVGYVFQEASLFAHLSLRRNLEYGHRRVAPADRRVVFDDVVSLLGVVDLLDRSTNDLSGGERRRAAACRGR